MIEAWANLFAGACQTGGMNKDAGFDPERSSGFVKCLLNGFPTKRVERGQGFPEFAQARFVFRNEILQNRLGIIIELLLEIKVREQRRVIEKF